MSLNKAKSCPCCSGKILEIHEEMEFSTASVTCVECGLTIAEDTIEKAIEKWNTRKCVERILERIEDMCQPCYLCREDSCAIDRAIRIVKEEACK